MTKPPRAGHGADVRVVVRGKGGDEYDWGSEVEDCGGDGDMGGQFDDEE